MKLDTGTSDLDEEYDKVRPHGMTRRQLIEKMIVDPAPACVAKKNGLRFGFGRKKFGSETRNNKLTT